MSEQPKSLFITSVLVKIVFVFLVAAPFFIPWTASWYDSVSMQEPIFWPLCICLYLTLIPAFILVFCLNRILSNVKTGAVFTAGTVKMLRVISYCCFTAAVIFAVLGIWRLLALLLCFAAAFVGLLLRVLKNVFQQAVLIREENDFTI